MDLSRLKDRPSRGIWIIIFLGSAFAQECTSPGRACDSFDPNCCSPSTCEDQGQSTRCCLGEGEFCGAHTECCRGYFCHELTTCQKSFGNEFELLENEKERCINQNGYISDDSNCCGYIRCVSKTKGVRMHCPVMSVWHPTLCSCVSPDDYDECVVDGCRNLIAVHDDTCPDYFDEGECCLRVDGFPSQVYTFINMTHYLFKEEINQCPLGQKFQLDSCCCEGNPEASPEPCVHFKFDNGFNDISEIRGVPTRVRKRFEGAPSNPDGSSLDFFSDSTFVIPRFANVAFQRQLFLCVWVIFENIGVSQIILHNGDDQGAGSSVQLELIVTATEVLFVGGVKACDRVQDIFIPVDQDKLNAFEWFHICLSYDDQGFVVLYLDGDSLGVAVPERNRISIGDLNFVTATPLFDAVDIINDFRYSGPDQDYGDFIEDFMKGDAQTIIGDAQTFIANDMEFWIVDRDELVRVIVDVFTRPYLDLFFELEDAYNRMIGKQQQVRNAVQGLDDLAMELNTNLIPDALAREEWEVLPFLNSVLVLTRKARSALSDVDPELVDIAGFKFHIIDDYLNLALSQLNQLGRKKRSAIDLESLPANAAFVEVRDRMGLALDVTSGRQKREPIDVPGIDPNMPIIASKFPLRVGDGLQATIDEVVICTFVPDAQAISDLYFSNVTPRQPQGIRDV